MKSNLTKAKEISQETKQKVLERQNGLSISGVWLGRGVEFHHILHRSSQGCGEEFNIVGITPEEHRAYHDHQPIKVNGKVYYTWEEFDTLMKNHLKLRYNNWTLQGCKVRKGNYDITRKSSRIS